MMNVSSEFRSLVKNGVKLVNYADITLKDGTVLNLGPSDFSVGGFSMTDKTSNGKFEIGTAIAKTITVTIANHTNKFSAYDFYKAIIYMYIAVEKADGTVLKERKGKYYVINPTTPGDTIKLSGVDSMYLFDKPFNSDLPFPATLQTLLSTCCTDCGVNIGFGQFANWNFEVKSRPEDCTYREIVSWVAQIAGYNARISNNDYLELVWYETSLFDIDSVDGGNFIIYKESENYDGGDFSFNTGDVLDGGNFTDPRAENVTRVKSLSVSTDDVIITGVKVEFDNVVALAGTEGYVISIKNNPLTESKEQEIADMLFARVGGLRTRPMSCQIPNNPLLEPFDVCVVYDRKGNGYNALINNVTFSISGFTTIACNADDPVRNESSYTSEAAKAVVQARREASELSNQAQIAAEKNAEAKAAELASKAATEAYEKAEEKAQQLAEAAQQASGEEAARLAEAAREAAEEAAQLKAESAKAEAIAEAAREAAELANQALEEAKRYSDENLTMYDRAVQNMNLLAANAMGLYRESETQSDGSVIYYMSNRPIIKNENGICEFEVNSVVYKMTGDGFFVSEDGGLSYTSGFDANGNAVVNVLSAIGITFDWARGGTISLGGFDNMNGVIKMYDKDGNQVGYWSNNEFYIYSEDYSPEKYPDSLNFDIRERYIDLSSIGGNSYYLYSTIFNITDGNLVIEFSNTGNHEIVIKCLKSTTSTSKLEEFEEVTFTYSLSGKKVNISNLEYSYITKINVSDSGIMGVYSGELEYRLNPKTDSIGNKMNFLDGTLTVGRITLGERFLINNKAYASAEIIANDTLLSPAIGYNSESINIDIPVEQMRNYSYIQIVAVSTSGVRNDMLLVPFSTLNPYSLTSSILGSSSIEYIVTPSFDTTHDVKIIARRGSTGNISIQFIHSSSNISQAVEMNIFVLGIV